MCLSLGLWRCKDYPGLSKEPSVIIKLLIGESSRVRAREAAVITEARGWSQARKRP